MESLRILQRAEASMLGNPMTSQKDRDKIAKRHTHTNTRQRVQKLTFDVLRQLGVPVK